MPTTKVNDEQDVVSRQDVSNALLGRNKTRIPRGWKARNTLSYGSRASAASPHMTTNGARKIALKHGNNAGENGPSKRQKQVHEVESISDSEEDVLSKPQRSGRARWPERSFQKHTPRSSVKTKPRLRLPNHASRTKEYASVEEIMSSREYANQTSTNYNKSFLGMPQSSTDNSPDHLARQSPRGQQEAHVSLEDGQSLMTTKSQYFKERTSSSTGHLMESAIDLDEGEHPKKPYVRPKIREAETDRLPYSISPEEEKELLIVQPSSVRRTVTPSSVLQEIEPDTRRSTQVRQRLSPRKTSPSKSDQTSASIGLGSRGYKGEQSRFPVQWFATDLARNGKQGDFSLVYNESTHCLDMQTENAVVEEDLISLNTLLKMESANDETTLLQVSMSKRETKSTKAMFNFQSHQTFVQMVLFLEKRTRVELTTMRPERMRNVVQNFQQQRHNVVQRSDLPDDIRLIMEKKRHQEAAVLSQDEGEPDNKKTKTKRKLRDRLQDGIDEDIHLKEEFKETEFRPVRGKASNAASSGRNNAENSSRRHTGIDELLKATELVDSKLKRPGLRPKNTTQSIVLGYGSDFIEQFPERPRYSQVHGLGKEWKRPLTFPKEGKRKATVEFSDLPKLDEDQCLNDNLIDFYLRHLIHNLEKNQPETGKSVYFFNTYFFSALKGASTKINYNSVKKWTRGVDLFTHDFVVVPINENFHWYVAVICNLPNLTRNAPAEPLESDAEISTPIGHAADRGLERHRDSGTQAVGDKASALKIIPAPYSDNVTDNPDGHPELEEEKTRESFSDLSLDDDQKSRTASPRNDVEEQENHIMNDGIEGTEASSPNQTIEVRIPKWGTGTPNHVNEIGDLPAQGKAEKASLSQKKGKRKSLYASKTIPPDSPAIVTLDSLGFSHPPAIKALKQYLCEEAKEKRGGMTIAPAQIKGLTAKGIPQQSNFSDCGLYLLGYMDKFVENPREFATKLLQKQHDEITDWPQLQPSEMRARVRELIQSLHQQQENERADKIKKMPRVSDTSKVEAEGSVQAESLDKSTKDKKFQIERAAQSFPIQDEQEKRESEYALPPNQGANHAITRQSALESALPINAPAGDDGSAQLKSETVAMPRTASRSRSPAPNLEANFEVPNGQEGETSELTKDDLSDGDPDQHTTVVASHAPTIRQESSQLVRHNDAGVGGKTGRSSPSKTLPQISAADDFQTMTNKEKDRDAKTAWPDIVGNSSVRKKQKKHERKGAKEIISIDE